MTSGQKDDQSPSPTGRHLQPMVVRLGPPLRQCRAEAPGQDHTLLPGNGQRAQPPTIRPSAGFGHADPAFGHLSEAYRDGSDVSVRPVILLRQAQAAVSLQGQRGQTASRLPSTPIPPGGPAPGTLTCLAARS
jgi:hypothetical protein